MKSYPRSMKLAEFIKTFRDHYVYEGANGLPLIAMTSNEALLLSKYLFRGIIVEGAAVPADGTVEPPDLGESLERFAKLNIRETNLKLLATDEDLRSLGAFLAQGLAAVFLTLENAHAHERAYGC